jgi:23S rRNA pseudouridine1911/1915/1917 synthase
MEIIYEDENVKVIDKPAGIDSETIPGRAHRLAKDTSGVLIIAKNEQTLDFLQKQFQERKTEKIYTALISGNINNKEGKIETLLGRSPQDRRKQKVFLPNEPGVQNKRDAVTEYKLIKRFKDYDLLEVKPKTGRKHQIRVHMAYLGHPIVGDKLYGFKNQLNLEGLDRQFLHASMLKIQLPNGEIKEFQSPLSKKLNLCLQKLKTL